jgi:Outer membrane protein beta-barrel domain
MKKLFLFTAFAVTTGVATQAQVKFGAHAGINVASYTEKYTSGSQSTTDKFDSKVGLTIGVVAEISLADALAFRPELNYTQKGGQYKDSETFFGTTVSTETTITTNYVEIPLNVIYKFEAGGGNVFVGAGPSIGYGLSGKYKEKITTGPTTTEDKTDIKFDGKANASDGKYHLKGLDFGATFLAGYQLSNNLFFKASYNLGLSNLSPEDNVTAKNKGFGFTIGYMFGGSDSED